MPQHKVNKVKGTEKVDKNLLEKKYERVLVIEGGGG